MNVSLPFEDHNVAYQCKGLNQSNIVCEYEVNQLMKMILQKSKTSMQMIKLLYKNVKCQGHMKVTVITLHVCEKVLT